MKLLFPVSLVGRLKRELRRGKSREIGGVLVGEHLADETFRIVDLSVQHSGGTAVHFERDPVHHKEFLADFFKRTGQDYRRFNYIGEWHSHPSFEPIPSGEDFITMRDLVEDPAVGVNFAVLIIARLHGRTELELSATLFRRGTMPTNANLVLDDDLQKPGIFRCIWDFLKLRKGG